MLRAVWLLMLLVLSGCGSSGRDVLRVGTDVWPGYETLYLARHLGYYDKTRIRLVELPTSTDVMEAFRSGRLEVAALTLDEALSLMADGFKLKTILVFDFSNGADAVLAKPGITSLAELRGCRISAERSAVGGLMLQSALDAAGLTLADVQLVNCNGHSNIDCYEQSDAIVVFEPAKTLLLEKGARLLWDSSRIPHRIVDVLVASEPVVRSRPKALKRLVSGYFSARNFFTEQRRDALRLMAAREHVSAEQFGASLGGLDILDLEDNRSLLASEPAQFEQTARRLAAFMRSHGMVAGAIGLEGFSWPEFLPEGNH